MISSGFLLSPSMLAQYNIANVGQTGGYAFDYVLLLDTSGSMVQDHNPPLFPILQDTVIEFIDSLPPGANIVIYTFDEKIEEVGTWKNFGQGDRIEIRNQVNNLKADGKETRMWDGFCQGMSDLESLADSDNKTHVQALLSYTDGKDTSSDPNSKPDCLAKFKTACDAGTTFWAANFVGIEPPQDLQDLDCTEVIVDKTITPLRVVQIRPTELELGNLYDSGEKEQACVLFWPFGKGVIGRSLSIAEPPMFSGQAPPPGMDMQICPHDSDTCEREIQIANDPVCFDFSLLNFRDIKPEEEGEYSFVFTLKTLGDQTIAVFPSEIKGNFSLIPTPEPTPTIDPGIVNFTCDPFRLEPINVSNLQAEQFFETKIECTIDWGSYNLEPQIQMRFELPLEGQDNPLPLEPKTHIWFDEQGRKADTIILTKDDDHLFIGLEIPANYWKSLQDEQKRITYRVPIEIVRQDFVQITGDKPEEVVLSFVVPIYWTDVLRDYWWAFLLIFAMLIILLFSTRPRFISIANLTISYKGKMTHKLTDARPKKWWNGAIILGGGDSAISLEKVEDAVLKIAPSWHGSLFGRWLRKTGGAQYVASPLGDATIKTQLGEFIPREGELEILADERFTLIPPGGPNFKINVSHIPKNDPNGFKNEDEEPFSGI